MALEIEHRLTEQGAVIVQLRGRVVLGADSGVIERLVEEQVAAGRREVIFDLSQVTHIDSTGIGRFIACHGRLLATGGKMCLAAAAGQVRESFRATRLDTVFDFCADVETAEQRLADSRRRNDTA